MIARSGCGCSDGVGGGRIDVCVVLVRPVIFIELREKQVAGIGVEQVVVVIVLFLGLILMVIIHLSQSNPYHNFY